MGIQLEKGQKISLNKQDGTQLSKIFLSAGWDMAKARASGGFFSKILSVDQGNIDLDASLIMLDANKTIVDAVYFGQLKSRDGSVQHSGDNLTGAGDGDDEMIHVNLTQISANVQSLVFTISSFRGQSFENVENAFCRVVDTNTQEEIAKYNLSQRGNYTALIVAKLYRHNGQWKMGALGETCNGRTFKEMLPAILPLL